MFHKRFCIEGMTDRGRKRPSNQDYVLVDPEQRFFILADGVGGTRGGHLAARLAVKTVQRRLLERLERPRSRWIGGRKENWLEVLESAFIEANAVVAHKAARNSKVSRMACTLVAGVCVAGHCYCASVGDSRIYQCSQGKMAQISTDQTLGAGLLADGVIGRDDPKFARFNRMLTQTIGGLQDKPLEVQLFQLEMPKDSCLMACSDGLTDMLSDIQIKSLLRVEGSWAERVSRLVDRANRAGGLDNISVVLTAPKGAAPAPRPAGSGGRFV